MNTGSVDDATSANNDGAVEDIINETWTTFDVSQYEVTREVDIEAISSEKATHEYGSSMKEITRDIGIEQISDDIKIPQSSQKDVIHKVGNALIRLELDIACCSEKLINMNLLMMHVAAKENDFEIIASDKEDSFDSYGQAVEFDILSGIFDLEVNEMSSFICTLEKDVNSTSKVISCYKHLGGAFLVLEEKLLDADELVNQLQKQVSELMMQSAKLQRILSSLNQEEISDEDRESINSSIGSFFNTTKKLEMLTSEQQRHILRMLKKSLARETELKNELKNCMESLDTLKKDLWSSQQEVLCSKEETAAIYSKFLQADSASTVFMGISKELIGKLQLSHLKINSALCHEDEMNHMLQECTEALHNLGKKEAAMHELAEKSSLEASCLKEKVDFLEKQLKASESSEINGIASLASVDSQNEHPEIKKLKEQVFIAESRAQKAESESKLLTEANHKLTEELNMLSNCGVSIEKVDSLEKQLRERDVQLQEARASIEASQEQQTMLYSSINDMEILIEKLKSKVSEANARADSAEDKCIILSEGHAELNEEVNFLRGKLECLEASLQKAEETKRVTAKDINIRTKVISDTVMQLAVERERLQKQLSLLMIENKALVDQLHMADKVSSKLANHEVGETEKGNKIASDATEVQISSDDVNGSEGNLNVLEIESKLETVRTIDAGRLNAKYVFSAILVALIAVLGLCFVQPENCPF